jgi:hypothetical protein
MGSAMVHNYGIVNSDVSAHHAPIGASGPMAFLSTTNAQSAQYLRYLFFPVCWFDAGAGGFDFLSADPRIGSSAFPPRCGMKLVRLARLNVS